MASPKFTLLPGYVDLIEGQMCSSLCICLQATVNDAQEKVIQGESPFSAKPSVHSYHGYRVNTECPCMGHIETFCPRSNSRCPVLWSCLTLIKCSRSLFKTSIGWDSKDILKAGGRISIKLCPINISMIKDSHLHIGQAHTFLID